MNYQFNRPAPLRGYFILPADGLTSVMHSGRFAARLIGGKRLPLIP
jgi:hypothetical protein